MSQLLHGAESNLGWLMGSTTVFFITAMVGWTLWTFSPGRRDALDAASRLPLDPDGDAP